MRERYKPVLRILAIIAMDILLIGACAGLALLARFEFSFGETPQIYQEIVMRFIMIQIIVTLVVFWLRKMYHYVWRTVGACDVADMIVSTFLAFAVSYVCARLLGVRLPASMAFVDLMCLVITQVGMRCSLRFFNLFVRRMDRFHKDGERILLMGSDVRFSDVQDVQVEDLLGREPMRLDTEAVSDFLRDKTVLVTGGGGSIGSELCRQIARYEPRQLIILDIYENNAYDIQQELISRFGGLDLRVEIASVRDKEKVCALFERYRPDVVFHAAAHKHVPLMEGCPEEAIKNNIFGTWHVVRAAEKCGVKKFVMISTDKAVNPTSIMGATKRYCEMILQSRTDSETEFCAVRFGNVLGSNGSVVPLFKRQIEAGGPVTLTDKRIIRYFMTIPEASQLVLEAGAMARRGQIFVLDMGEPVKILTLAENLIRLSGLKPYQDIEIREIGLRPGEKLYEELLMRNETLLETANEKIFVEQQTAIPEAEIRSGLARLAEAVSGEVDKAELAELMKQLVPTYRDPEEVNAGVTGEEIALAAAGQC